VRVTVDQDRCVGSGQCVMSADTVFDQREDDGIVVLLTDNPPAAVAEDVKQAAAVCPALAITVASAGEPPAGKYCCDAETSGFGLP
jgi:ferredoxin